MNVADRLAHGESVPGGPGACDSCGHALVWHRRGGRRRPCERCDCAAFASPGAVSSSSAAAARPSRRKPRTAPAAETDQLALFDLGEVS